MGWGRGTWDWNDIRKHGACVERGHDLRRVGDTNYFNCKCGASARLVDGGSRLEIDHSRPKSLEEKKADSEKRRRKHERQTTA